MHSNHPKEDPLVEMGYEIRDINAPSINKAIIWFFIFTFVMFGSVFVWFIIWGQQGLGYRRDARKVVPGYPNPLPQSNVTTKADIMTLRQDERKLIEGAPTYSDKSMQFVRVPVTTAIDKYLTKGYPEPSIAVPAKSVGNTIAQNATGPLGY